MPDTPEFAYVLPNDADEHRRLDMQHRCLTISCGGLYYRPELVEAVLSTPTKTKHAIIDLGTGSGAWAQDMAVAFPDADVTGVDIVPPRSSASTPPNCRFYFEDINKGFRHYDKCYSVVHMRMIAQGIDNFQGVFHNVAEILNPGGILLSASGAMDIFGEDKKPIPTVSEGKKGWSAIQAIWTLYQEVIKERFNVDAYHEWAQVLRNDPMYESASVGDEVFYIPLGTWTSGRPGHLPSEVEAGQIMRDNFRKLIPNTVNVIAKNGALDSDTLDRWLLAAMKQMEEMDPPTYIAIVVTWAKRSNVEFEKVAD